MDIDPTSEPSSFIGAIFESASRLAKKKGRKITSLKRLADRKLAELESTHNEFITLLRSLSAAGQTIHESLAKSDNLEELREKLRSAILAIDAARGDGLDKRIKSYSEAHVYSERLLGDTGIMKHLDKPVAENLRLLMHAYVEYFHTDNIYMHAVGQALARIRKSTVIMHVRDKRLDLSKLDLDSAAQELEKIAVSAVETARGRWQIFVSQYHKFNFCLHERGLIE